jgi:hypothetical protein
MIRVSFARVKPEKEAKLRSWLNELNERADEVRATFRDETVRAEQAFIVRGSDGPMLVYVMEAERLRQGSSGLRCVDPQNRRGASCSDARVLRRGAACRTDLQCMA